MRIYFYAQVASDGVGMGMGWLVGGWSEEMETQQPASLCLIFVLR